MRKVIVKNIKKNVNITKYIFDIFPSIPNSSVYKALRNKDIKVNGKRISGDIPLFNGDILEIYISDAILFNIPKSIQYVYEDDNILVAYKPQGVLSNNEDTYDSIDNIYEPTLEDLVKVDKDNINIKICHRLDRNTAGLVIFSKNDESHEEMLNGFKNGFVLKEYIAYVSNAKFSKVSETLTSYILKDTKTEFSKIYDSKVDGSKKIITEYTVLEKNLRNDFAKLSIKIHTGKTHQIRAHMSYIDHPIIGDSKYGLNSVNRKFNIHKQLLFAYKYDFCFPENSYLDYLNEISIITDIPNYSEKLIGSD